MFTVIPSTTRSYGYAIKAPPFVKWAKGPDITFGWYRLKRDAQKRVDALNRLHCFREKRPCDTASS